MTAPTRLVSRAKTLLELHHGRRPVVLPNVWDVASAADVAVAGFAAVATSSHAVAAVLGFADDDSADPDVVFPFLARIGAAVDRPVSADLEAGYRLAPAELVDRMLAAGIVGANLEDSDHHGDGVLVPAERQAERLAAVRAAADADGIHLVLNARIDAVIHRVGDERAQLDEVVRRGRLYLSAGADCVFPIGMSDEARIRELVTAVPGPVNILAHPGGLGIAQLAALGVQRISFGAGLFGVGREAVRHRLAELRSDSEA